jgi:hypothetical protein
MRTQAITGIEHMFVYDRKSVKACIRIHRVKHLLAVLVVVAAALAVIAVIAVSNGDDDDTESAESTRSIPGDADPGNAAVIDEWAMTLAAGDVEGAAEFFAIPSVAENGGVIIEIESPDDARLFNASLPCGAELTRAEGEGEFTVATFRLIERPGPGTCGSGTGMTASTAFVIEEGEIVEWRRVDDGGPEARSTPA